MPVLRTRPRSGRKRILDILNGHDVVFGRSVALSIQVLILISATSFAISTLPDLSPRLLVVLLWFERAAVTLFALEYALRLFAAPNRLRYVVSFWGIIDLLAWAPSLLMSVGAASAFRMLRLVQVLRILKIIRYSRALRRLGLAFKSVKEELTIFLFVAVFLVYLSSVGIYFFENPAQPDVFTSIPHSFWWAMVTLTTVGYGDIVPITMGGRMFTTIILFLGMGVFAVPAGVIASALIGRDINVIERDIEEIETAIEESLDKQQPSRKDAAKSQTITRKKGDSA